MIFNKIKPFHIISIGYFLVLCIWFYFSCSKENSFDFSPTHPNPYYFEPVISIWISNFIKEYFNGIITNLLVIVVIPYSIYLLLFKIYSRNISFLWSSFLALLSLSVYENLSFHTFLLNIFRNSIENVTTDNSLLIFEFPLPGFSTLYFLLAFYFLTAFKKIHIPIITFCSLLVAIDFYINAIDALFLISFWIIYFPFKIFREKIYTLSRVVLISVMQIGIIILFVLPGLVTGQINPELSRVDTLPLYNIILYLFLPLLIMVVLYFIQRIDLFEILFKFRHIYALLFVEIFVIILTSTNIVPIDLQILRSRILQFFIHLYYFVPIIYYVSRPVYHYTRGSEAKSIAAFLRKNLFWAYSQSGNVLAVILTVLLFIYDLFPLLTILIKLV